jgi:hypothetical protein
MSHEIRMLSRVEGMKGLTSLGVNPWSETVCILTVCCWLKSGFHFVGLHQTGPRLVKRRQALVHPKARKQRPGDPGETDLSRNGQQETHRSDELGSHPKPAPHFLCVTESLIDVQDVSIQ